MKIIFVLLLAAATCAADQHKPSENKQEQSSRVTTITSIVDQTGGEFVISKGKDLQGMVYLRAQGFTPDNFARFVGNRVRMEGKFGSEGDRRTFTVTNLASIKKVVPQEDE